MQLDRVRRTVFPGALLSVAILGALNAPSAAAGPRMHVAAGPAASTGGFVHPAPGAVTYAAKGSINVRWTAGDVSASRWKVTRLVAPLDWTGGCAAASGWQTVNVQIVAVKKATFAAHLADRCYRYSVRALPTRKHAAPTYVSGEIRTLSAWQGAYDLFRAGAFSSQRTMSWCVGASVQMMVNLVRGTSDHSGVRQENYFHFARQHDAYKPGDGANGTDPRGWSETLVHYGAGAYHDAETDHYKEAVRTAARRLRETGRPVGLVVAHSNHAWVMTGFAATADPALDATAQITAVYVMGPLYPRTSHDGYDPTPDTRLSFEGLKAYLTRYYDSLGPHNPWEGSFVTILP